MALKTGGYREDYDGSVYKVIPNNSILDYPKKKVSCGEIINNSAEINVTELGNKTVLNVFGSLGSATNYGVAGEFHNDGDMEGNIATDLFLFRWW